MHHDALVYSIFIIFTGAALFSTLALYTRQSLLTGYILLGIILGPWAAKLVTDTTLINHVGEVGIIFLFFLLGLDLDPKDLWHILRKVTFVTIVSSLAFSTLGFLLARLFNFSVIDSLIIGAALVFSSTIIGLKMLSKKVLHHRHVGEVMIGVLLMQDLLAIVLLVLLRAMSTGGGIGWSDSVILIALPFLMLFAFIVEYFILNRLFKRFEGIQEYIFLLAIGWCLGIAELGNRLGLSEGVGAFIAGVSIAAGPIAVYIRNNLKPLRDFFLVLFFFSIGASFNLSYVSSLIFPLMVFVLVSVLIKPWLFAFLFKREREVSHIAREIGWRLGQTSEFSILLAYMAAAASPAVITPKANYLIQSVTIVSFIVSTYIVTLKYPTPISSQVNNDRG